MTTITDPGTFSETAFLSITLKGGTDIEYRTLIENFEVSGGEKGFDSIATIAGGRLKKFNPQEDVEVTVEGYAVEVGTNAGTTGEGFYNLMHSDEASTGQPLSISVDHERDLYQLVILYTDDPNVSDARDAVTSGYNATRLTMSNGHFTNVESSFSDKICKYTITFKCTPFNKAGTANVVYESTDGTAALTAVSAYS